MGDIMNIDTLKFTMLRDEYSKDSELVCVSDVVEWYEDGNLDLDGLELDEFDYVEFFNSDVIRYSLHKLNYYIKEISDSFKEDVVFLEEFLQMHPFIFFVIKGYADYDPSAFRPYVIITDNNVDDLADMYGGKFLISFDNNREGISGCNGDNTTGYDVCSDSKIDNDNDEDRRGMLYR